MNTSEQINELATALAKAQGEITGALKESKNPFFKSSYADLASCWDACRGPLSKNGLAVIQVPQINATHGFLLLTRLMHASGQWMESELPVHPKDDSPQSMGSALTYARRYALTAMVGIAQIDDDGNAASGKVSYGNGTPAYDAPHSPKGDMGKSIAPDTAEKAAITMRDILESDVDEDVKTLHVADRHEALNKDADLYVAAADKLSAAERKSWKTYVSLAKKRETAEPAGRRW